MKLTFVFRSRRTTIKENYRETEKAVLDSILGKGYDKRIRPSGQNITGMPFPDFLLHFPIKERELNLFEWYNHTYIG